LSQTIASTGSRMKNGVTLRSPLLERADHRSPSVFLPENLLREARRQKGLLPGRIPEICILDPDGDIVDFVRRRLGAERSPHWACYHTALWEWQAGAARFGIVGSAVGGAFAVLVAEQLFVSGCELLVSIASAGQIAACVEPPCHILIERALRDEGTSHHYLPPSPFADGDRALLDLCARAFAASGREVQRGATWTTDAPFRETADAIAARRRDGLLAVEMEAAALYAFARMRSTAVVCLAHVTNQLGCIEGDFEKGAYNGASGSLDLVLAIAEAWRARTHTESLTELEQS
jgi:nucleoside phosphorylase